ncbi:MAG TPA: hypothetical protein VE975_09085 [Actinomycetota bacterium]|jgi:hypothetical protein|nr:hypothetical protein [Actinomycetota bacterium]
MTGSARTRGALAVIAALSVMVTGAGCQGGRADAPQTVRAESPEGSLPSWITRVSPEPQADASIDTTVRIGYDINSNWSVGLVIDGVDVTAHSTVSEEEISYDPDEGPLSLDPGPHVVSVKLYKKETESISTLIDTYSFSFEAL